MQRLKPDVKSPERIFCQSANAHELVFAHRDGVRDEADVLQRVDDLGRRNFDASVLGQKPKNAFS